MSKLISFSSKVLGLMDSIGSGQSTPEDLLSKDAFKIRDRFGLDKVNGDSVVILRGALDGVIENKLTRQDFTPISYADLQFGLDQEVEKRAGGMKPVYLSLGDVISEVGNAFGKEGIGAKLSQVRTEAVVDILKKRDKDKGLDFSSLGL
ncbi:hypothetical protein ACYPKM_00255 [Pseudomonas aeruginosa]